MYKNKKIIAIIPARGGSKRIPKKNIKFFCGLPLIAHTIKSALNSKYIDRVIVSTDSKEIMNIVKKYKAEAPFLRPKYLSEDDIGPDYILYQHTVKWLKKHESYKPDIIVELQPTSPLRISEDIDSSIKKIVDSKADTVLSLCEAKSHPSLIKKISKGDIVSDYISDAKKYFGRQDFPKAYIFNGAILAVTHEQLMLKNSDIGKNIRAVIMPFDRSIDIDDNIDFLFAEILKRKYAKNN